ncbi:STAS/SEC14 domain-containing protein [Actinoplanes hulinensis]|uniref:STAS/SEC14 domain-containing protein n=1 Tax=Actinoplanes hulinensis TaxID=1144547 RepID=A0ABS7BE18_9ACTN|nr:STAS/SEC14 domain-containing protein [Actinoplanes hulinensis]MBW6438909.1 STAS/SEC14 domain-containing protein [Actinoplanes hulinensis]
MIEVLPDLPETVLGFRFAGSVTREEYRTVFLPRTRAALGEGWRIRLLVVVDDDCGWFQPGAFWEDLKFGLGTALRHHSLWERIALVSDAEWVTRALTVFGRTIPGEVRHFPRADLTAATDWLAVRPDRPEKQQGH